MIAFLTLFGSMDLMNTIYSGAIGADLLRPVSFFFYWMGRDFGKSLVNLVGRGVIFLLAYNLFFPVQLPGPSGSVVGPGGFIVVILVGQFHLAVSGQSGRVLDAGRARHPADCFHRLPVPVRIYHAAAACCPIGSPRWCSTPHFPRWSIPRWRFTWGSLTGNRLWQALWLQLVWFLVLAGLAGAGLSGGRPPIGHPGRLRWVAFPAFTSA